MRFMPVQTRRPTILQIGLGRLTVVILVTLLAGCGSTPDKTVAPVDETPAWSVSKVVHTDRSMITLLDPSDLVHHQAEPSNWFLHDFAIKDDLQTGRFAAVLTNRAGKFNVRVTFGELTEEESIAAGAEARMRLRVINGRLLLSGGDAWPSVETDYQRFAYDHRWIGIPNGDYGVIITVLKPGASPSDYVFQLIKVKDLSYIKHAPGVPKLVYGQPAQVVNVNAKGFRFNEQCNDVPSKAIWAPMVSSTMPIPGSDKQFELPRSLHSNALYNQNKNGRPSTPIVVARYPEVGTYGFYLKPRNWEQAQTLPNGDVTLSALVRCAVQITEVVATPDNFSLGIKAIPTATDRLPAWQKQQLVQGFDEWLRGTNDPAWHFKSAKAERSTDDASLILGIVDYLNLNSKESESLLPMSNGFRVEYLLDKLQQF